MSEEIITFGNARTLVGVLHRPEGPAPRADLPAVLLLNAGLLHRVGPNRLYVKIARRLERSGFLVLRFDVWGIGDSQGHAGETKGRTFVDDTLEAFEVLKQRFGATRFMLMGICMGAQIALEVASRDPRVDSLVLMEGIYVKSARYHVSRLLNPRKWMRVFTGESQAVKRLRQKLFERPKTPDNGRPAVEGKAGPTGDGNLTVFLDKNRDRNMKEQLRALLERGTKIILIFRDGNEIAYNYRLRKEGDEIFAVGLPRGLDVAFVRFADHTFTPLLSQDLLLKAMMKWVEAAHRPTERAHA